MEIRKIGLVLLLLATTFSLAQSDRKHLTQKRPAGEAALPFSEGVLAGNTLYVAGRIGVDVKTGKPPANAEDEAKAAMESMKSVVEQAGMEMDDLVFVQVFCTDFGLYDTFNSVYKTYFNGDYPARAFVGANSLLLGARFEVTGIAVKEGAKLHPAEMH